MHCIDKSDWQYAIISRAYRSVVVTRLRLVHGIEPLRLPLREVKVTTVQICCAIPEGWFDGRRDLSSHSSAVDRTSFESGQGAGVRFSPCEPHSDPSISPTNFWLVFRKKISGVCLEGRGTNVGRLDTNTDSVHVLRIYIHTYI